MFFADIDHDADAGAFGRKKHGYRGGFGVSYGGGDSSVWGLFRALNWVASATFLHSAVTVVQSNAAAAAASNPAVVSSLNDLTSNPVALRCAICLAYLFAFFGLSVVTTAPGFWAAQPNRPKKRVLSAELVVGASTILYGVCATESATTRAVLGAGLCALVALRQAQH